MGLLEKIANWLRQLSHTADPIKHVVVLMFENHSFDQMLGCFKDIYPELEGVDRKNLCSNKDAEGRDVFQRQSNNTVVKPDPKHELDHIVNQLKGNNGGFVSEYQKEFPGENPDAQRIMDYFGMDDLPALHELAKHFTICDHWFSSVPGPTWTNRFFVHSGTSKGRVRMPETWHSSPLLYLGYNQDSIYDRLNEAKRSWRIYHGDVPQSLMLKNQRSYTNRKRYAWLDQFFEDTKGPEESFPEYVFIEPRYFHIPFESPQNDDHPPHATVPAQELLADVYNALRGNKDLWNSTLLVILYDEHGGFYDHVVPPPAVPPDQHKDEYSFDQFGVRVPALLVSPWVEKRVVPTPFDHTSLLKYVIDKWNLRPLTKRVDAATSIRDAISVVGTPRTDTPAAVRKPPEMMMAGPDVAEPDEELNDFQKSLADLSEFLESEVPLEARPKLKMMAEGPTSEAVLARQRVAAFLNTDESHHL